MNDSNTFERFVADQFEHAHSGHQPTDAAIDDIVLQASRSRQRPRWLALAKEPPMRISSTLAVGSPTVRVVAVMVATLLITLMVAGAGLAGSRILAAEEDHSSVPSPISGTIEFVADTRTATETMTRGLMQFRGGSALYDIEMSDPRVSGLLEPLDQAIDEQWGVFAIRGPVYLSNDEGSWLGTWEGACEPSMGCRLSGWLAGEGAYDGLTFFINARGDGLSGDCTHTNVLSGVTAEGLIFKGVEPALLPTG